MTPVDVSISKLLETVGGLGGGCGMPAFQFGSHGFAPRKAARRVRGRGAGASSTDEDVEDETVTPDEAACMLAIRAAAGERPRQLVTFEDVNRAVTHELNAVKAEHDKAAEAMQARQLAASGALGAMGITAPTGGPAGSRLPQSYPAKNKLFKLRKP